MSESDDQNKPKRGGLRPGCLPLEAIIKQKAAEQGIPESEVKMKLAFPQPDGRDELTMQEIQEIVKQFQIKRYRLKQFGCFGLK